MGASSAPIPDSFRAAAARPIARVSFTSAAQYVAARDPALKRLIALAGPLRYEPRSADGHFGSLARAIVFQQLAGAAARTILGRVIAAAEGELMPEKIVRLSDAKLRAAGLSANKLASLRDLSDKVLDGTVDLDALSKRADEAIIEQLITVRGIGRWTAEMFLIFQLRRLDVWPVDDYGVRQGYRFAWRMDEPPSPKQLAPLGEKFRPYRSIVARYCWKAVALARAGTRFGR